MAEFAVNDFEQFQIVNWKSFMKEFQKKGDKQYGKTDSV
jgi:hypothetical protein